MDKDKQGRLHPLVAKLFEIIRNIIKLYAQTMKFFKTREKKKMRIDRITKLVDVV